MERQPSSHHYRLCLTSCCLFAVGLLLTAKSFASSDIPQQIIELLNKQQISEAYVLAEAKQNELEGEADFDLAFGLAAKATDNCNLAVYALERVVQVQPQTVSARFALATCYYELGNLAAAEVEFNHLALQKMSPEMQNVVEQNIRAIERRQSNDNSGWHNTLQLGLGQDSNPNNGIENEFITVPLLGQVKLFEQSQAISSSFYDLNAQFSYVAPLTQTSRWYTSLGASYTGYSEELAQSKSNFNAIVGYTGKLAGKDVGTRVFYRPLWLDGESFLDYYGLIIEAGQAVFSQSSIGGELTLGRLDYADFTELSRDQLWFNLWFETPTFAGLSRFSLKLGDEQSQESQMDFNSRQLLGAGYSFTQQLSSRWYYKLSADYLKAEYAEDHPLFAQTREDKFMQLVVDLHYQWRADWLLTAQMSVVDNRSNLALYDYNRSNLWIGARYQF
ncbi:porin family protein [Paraglaciecola hydrolytica]|uniref:Uncharacterized protein n=1 Tax=Paraglaciecola hydrolytica TaxID=1799789 RepID=A0A136A5C0_9ALTE|nr:porin family protein [Paraglaciecola hydrolytica]KXI30404.1 hypothetical protein AX660_10575 [Paraglaciecola hydrolytica]